MEEKVEKVWQQIANEVAALVRAQRAFLDLQQEDIAKRTGVSLSTVHRVERGKANIRIATLGKIAAGMGIRFRFGITPLKEEVPDEQNKD